MHCLVLFHGTYDTIPVLEDDEGNVITSNLKLLFCSRFCCRWFRSERLKSEIPSRSLRKKLRRRLIDEEVGDEMYMPTDSIGIPIIVNIVLIFGYVFLGATVCRSFLLGAKKSTKIVTKESVYLSVVVWQLGGLGLRDCHLFLLHHPDDHWVRRPLAYEHVHWPRVHHDDIRIGQDNHIGFLLFRGCVTLPFHTVCGDIMKGVSPSLGLAVLSLCLSLIQEQIEKKAKRMSGEEEVIEMDVVVMVPRRKDITKPDNQQPKSSNDDDVRLNSFVSAMSLLRKASCKASCLTLAMFSFAKTHTRCVSIQLALYNVLDTSRHHC